MTDGEPLYLHPVSSVRLRVDDIRLVSSSIVDRYTATPAILRGQHRQSTRVSPRSRRYLASSSVPTRTDDPRSAALSSTCALSDDLHIIVRMVPYRRYRIVDTAPS